MTDDPDYAERYRRELAYLAKKRLPEGHELTKFQVKHCPRDVLDVVEPQIFAACRASALQNDSVPFDVPLRRVEERDQSGVKAIRWVGSRSFVHDLKAPVRRVLGFRTEHGYVDITGSRLR